MKALLDVASEAVPWLALVEALLLLDESFDLMPPTLAKLAYCDRVSAFCRDFNDAIDAA